MTLLKFNPVELVKKVLRPGNFGPRKKLKKYVLREASILNDLRKDVERIKKLFLLHEQGDKSVLLKHYQKEAKKDERLSERIERRLDYLLSKVEESIGSVRGKYLDRNVNLPIIQQELEVAGRNLIRLVSWNGRLHQLLQEKKIDWQEVSRVVQQAYGVKRLNTSGNTPGIVSLLAALDELEQLDRTISSRRKMTKLLAAGVAGAAVLSHPTAAFAEELLDRLEILDDHKKIEAVIYACGVIEKEREFFTRRLTRNPIYTPHADYTHFNRTGEWAHSKILKEVDEHQGADYGATDSALFTLQRDEAREKKQPTDLDVSITERSLVTLANLAGRRKVKDKLFVPKHFPGGSPELELTEKLNISFRGDSTSLIHLKPFKDLIDSGMAQALMVCHANYPDIEREFFGNPIDKKIVNELSSLGLDEKAYWRWLGTRPASISPSIIRLLLREQLSFKGFVIPDALNMGSLFKKCTELFSLFPQDDLMTKNVFEDTFREILLIYAGVDFFLLNEHPGNIPFIEDYYSKNHFFKECFDESFNNYLKLFSATGKSKPKYFSLRDKMELLIKNKEFRFSREQDAWDRSGVLHQRFRKYFLAKLYDEEKIAEDINLFWELNQKTNWGELDRYFQSVIQERYLR